MLHQQIEQNKRRTVLIVFLFFLLFAALGAAIGYLNWDNALSGVALALIIGLAYVVIMVAQSTQVVMSLNNAKEITDKAQYPMLWNIVEEMTIVTRLPFPRIFIIEDESPNAFAAGNSPEKASVAVTTGLLKKLNREELTGVLAHEFAHIRNYDIRLSTVALAIAGLIAFLAQFSTRMMFWGGGRRRRSDNSGGAGIILLILSLLILVLSPFVATIIRLALSRNREYLADASAIEFTRNPEGLKSALIKIATSDPMEAANAASASLYIVNPFKRMKEGEAENDGLFSTHPSTANRIKRLEAM
ncbi:zinc metalloprotease HtpX [Trichococcus shcherbakoviae]|uniref:Protease HtpX homolog n=1 Tax=Trichococcus shcherbakoviae subsp. psychrophilus TaxID=2585775 RepID=A0A5C5ECJ9_9LACT|nr:zinc metalloprotease HtpX [Trichococcus shcherbakoviae]OUL08406.1 zinc metalloprotease HtpX [Sedimentibacter sp. SX930]TNV70478.1 zinc metalloprotease HtpX [Trichococcus shcherbakoviae subsp. psychrophilus]